VAEDADGEVADGVVGGVVGLTRPVSHAGLLFQTYSP
jgi:hypothetical protein